MSQRECLLESVVRMTENRDRRSIERSLVAILAELISAKRVALYLTCDGRVERVAEAGSTAGADGDADTIEARDRCTFAECLEKRATVVLSSAGRSQTRMGFPVTLEAEVIGLVAIDCGSKGPSDKKLIAAVINIYQNHLAVIDDGERDTLTKLLNRKTFDKNILQILVARRQALAKPAPIPDLRVQNAAGDNWLAILDIDHFKRINDAFGHPYGDEVLLLFSGIMKHVFRASDLLFRYGGEEFVVVLAPTDERGAWTAMERFRVSVEAYHFPQVGQVTVSAGFVRVDTQDMPSVLIGHADQALYFAKNSGRNKVCRYETLIADGSLQNNEKPGEIELF